MFRLQSMHSTIPQGMDEARPLLPPAFFDFDNCLQLFDIHLPEFCPSAMKVKLVSMASASGPTGTVAAYRECYYGRTLLKL